MVKESSTQSDGLLAPWLQAVQTRGDEAAESALALLIETHIEPVIRSVIRFKIRLGSAGQMDEADLAQESLAQWLAELQKLCAQPDDRSISDVRRLAATITYRVCYGWLRQWSPRRHALRNRLQYVLTRQAGLALWTGAGQSGQSKKLLIAGFAAWRGRASSPSEKLRQLPDDEEFLARAGQFAELWPQLPLDDATIAGLLNLTRQQVINLRKSARERLARRLKGFF